MKRLLSLLLLLSAMQSVAAVPAAADVPAAANNVPAAGRADAILAGVSDGFRALGAYGVSFEVRSDEYVTRGRYAVEGENYYLVLGDAEVYCDGAVRYEVDNRRREVTIDVVDTGSRNILNNPVHAFDFLGSEYAPPDMTALRRICPVRFPEPEARPGNSLPARHGSLPASAICSMRRLS